MKNFVFVVLLMLGAAGCSTTIDPGHAGVVTDWGVVQPWTFNEGFHWLGFGKDVYLLNTQTQAVDFSEAESIQVLSRDRLPMSVELTIQYKLHDGSTLPKVFQTFYTGEEEHYTERVIFPAARTAVRDVVSRLAAMEAVQQRDTLSASVRDRVAAEIGGILINSDVAPEAITIVGVQVRNISIPPRLQQSIERIQEAENAALERQQQIAVASQEAERARIEAEGRLAVARIDAQRAADATRIRAEGDADANRLVSQSLTPNLLRQQEIRAQMALAEHVQTVILGAGGGGNTTVIPIPVAH